MTSPIYLERAMQTEFRKGMKVERSLAAKAMLKEVGLERLAERRGTYFGKRQDQILVLLDGDKTVGVFDPVLWEVVAESNLIALSRDGEE